MKATSMRSLVPLLVAFLLAAPAFAAPSKPAEHRAVEAKEHAKKAFAFYGLGKYLEASAEFEEAYSTKPDGALLYNAAQSARLGGDLRKARTLYSSYVSFHPDGPNVSDAKGHLEKIEQQIQLEEAARKSAPPAPEHVTPPPKVEPAHTEPAHAHKDRPLLKKWWFWTAIGGGVVVVATAVTLGVVLSQPAPRWTNVNDIGPGASGTSSAVVKLHF